MAGHVGILGKAAVSGAWTPPVSGYKVWLDPTDAATFTFGTGTQVASWTDKSANAFVFTRTASSAITRSGTRNSLTTVDISAAGKLACTPGSPICTTAATIFVVCIKKGTAQTYEAFPFTMVSGSTSRPHDGWNFNRFKIGAAWTAAASDMRTQTLLCVLVNRIVSSGAGDEWKDGTSVVSGSYADAFNTTSQILTVASRADSATQFLGEVGDIIVYDTALTTTDRQSVEAALKSRWGTP